MDAERIAPDDGARALAPRGANGSTALAAATPASDLDRILTMLENPNLPTERINQALDLYERISKMKARMAFDAAIARAKAKIPPILKSTTVEYQGRDASKTATKYDHETLADIAKVVDPILGEHGLSYRFRATSRLNEPVRVTCIVSHELGYFEETELESGRDDSGGKNAVQAVGSALTYLQRYTLRLALGLAAEKRDTDGRVPNAPSALVDADEANALDLALADAAIEHAAFLEFYGIERTLDLPKGKLSEAYRNIAITLRQRNNEKGNQVRRGAK